MQQSSLSSWIKKKNMAKFKKKKKENFHKVNMYIVYVIVAYTR